MLRQGTMAKKTSQNIKKELEKTTDPLIIINILRKHIRTVAIEQGNIKKRFQTEK